MGVCHGLANEGAIWVLISAIPKSPKMQIFFDSANNFRFSGGFWILEDLFNWKTQIKQGHY